MSDDQISLRDEIALLAASIRDATAERDRGELTDEACEAIVARDEARAAELRVRLAALGDTAGGEGRIEEGAAVVPAPDSGRRRRQPWLLVVAAACLLVAAGFVVAATVRANDPSGPSHLTTAGKVKVLLVEGETELQHDDPDTALTAFDAVLRLDPTNGEALAESGWLRYEIALGARDSAAATEGIAELRQAVVVAPLQAAGHLYYGIVLWQYDHADAASLAQLTEAAKLPETTAEEDLTAQFLAIVTRSEHATRR